MVSCELHYSLDDPGGIAGDSPTPFIVRPSSFAASSLQMPLTGIVRKDLNLF